MTIWIKLHPFPSILVHWLLKCQCSLLPSPIWLLPSPCFGPNIPGSYAALFFIASDFTFTTRHIHSQVLFLPWLNLFIPSEAISPLFPCSMLGNYWPGDFLFKCHFFFLFILFMWFSRQECWSALPFPSPVHHILSEYFTRTHLSCVALHHMAHSFIEIVMAVIHVISLVSFLWLCFSFCLSSDGWG